MVNIRDHAILINATISNLKEKKKKKEKELEKKEIQEETPPRCYLT